MIALGIDIGVSSLGTAIINTKEEKIIHTGVYVFPAGKDAFGTNKEASKNETRRAARQSRRQNFRKRLRRYHLLRFLHHLSEINSPENDRYTPLTIEEIESWLSWDREEKSFARVFPESEALREWFALNPYEIRDRALREDISRAEFGRLLYHMIQRRGFQSSRKAKDTGAMAKGSRDIIGFTETEEHLGNKTLGQYLYSISAKEGEKYTEKEEKPRGRYTLRQMYVEELEQIWQRQAEQLGLASLEIEGQSVKELLMGQISYDPDTEEIRYKSNESILFWQRPLRSQKHLINKCSLESRKMYDPKKKREYIQGPTVAAISHPISEFHRALQVLSQVRIEGRTLYEMGLLETSLEFLLSKSSKTVKAGNLKKHLNLAGKLNYDNDLDLPGCPTIADITGLFNKGQLTFLYGETDAIYTDIWQKLSFFEDQSMLEANLREYATAKGLKLKSDFEKALLKIDLVDGYGSISIHAMNNIIPYLLEGRSHTESIFLGGVRNAFGTRFPYFEQDEKLWNDILEIINQEAKKGEKIDNLIAFLCDPEQNLAFDEKTLRLKLYHPTQSVQNIEVRNKLGKVDNLRNPIVEQALWAVRNQVNALIDMMIERTGNPNFRFDRINIELSRDLKSSLERRKKIRQEQASNQAKNDEAIKELKALGVGINRDNIQKYRLYKELLEQDGIARCPYTGKVISSAFLYNGDNYFQIEHIIPKSISLDDSYANKTLCESNFNREKGNNTPYEFYKIKPDPKLWGAENWDDISKRARRLLPERKASRFLSKKKAQEQLEELPSKMLNDTAYMSVKAKEYLSTICTDVRSIKGGMTAELRHMWGLNQILSDPYKVNPLAISEELLASGEKDVYALLDNETQVITNVTPKLNLIPNLEEDEVRIPVTVKGKKLMRGNREIKKPLNLDLKGVEGDAILSFSRLYNPHFEPLLNERAKESNKLIFTATLTNKNKLTSDFIEDLSKISKDSYPQDPGKYWVTIEINGTPDWELPSEKRRVQDKSLRIAGRLDDNKFYSPIFNTEVDNSVINLTDHKNRTVLLQPDYSTAVFTKILRPEPVIGDNQVLLTGIVNQGYFLPDESDNIKIDISDLQLKEQTKYYATFEYDPQFDPGHQVQIYPLYNKAPKPSRGESLIEGRLILLDKTQSLFGIEAAKNREDHRHHAIDALVIGLSKQSQVTMLSTFNREREEHQAGNTLERPLFELPWETFREDARKSINSILVYHKRRRKEALTKVTKKITKNGKVYTSEGYAVRGALHKDTIYGLRKAPNQCEHGYHLRKSISTIDKISQIDKVVDDAIRNEMLRILSEDLGLDISDKSLSVPRNAFIDDQGNSKVYLPNRKGGAPVPVKKVRMRENLGNAVKLKRDNQHVNPRNNHHAIIYEASDGTIAEHVVTLWEVTDRQNRGEEIFQLPEDGKRILFKLMINQMYIIGLTRQEILDNLQNYSYLSKHLYRVQKLSASYYTFRLATASTLNSDSEMISIQTPNHFISENNKIHAVKLDLQGKVKLKDD